MLNAIIIRKKTGRSTGISERSVSDHPVDPRNLPAYRTTEAARYLRIPVAVLRSWICRRPYRTEPDRMDFKALIALPDPGLGSLSFFNLIEAHVLHAIEEENHFPKIPLPRICSALDHARKRFGSNHPLAEKRFGSHGVNHFIDRFQGVIPLSESRRAAIRELIRAHLDRIEYDTAGLATRLYPFTPGNGAKDPLGLVLDPHVSFGSLTIRGTGIDTGIIAERHRAGDSMEALAHDYGCKRTQIEKAVRYERALAA